MKRLLVAVFGIAWGAAVQAGEVHYFFRGAFKSAVAHADVVERPLMVLAAQDTCGASKRAEKLLNGSIKLREQCNTHFVCVRLDVTKMSDQWRAGNLGASRTPSFVFLDPRERNGMGKQAMAALSPAKPILPVFELGKDQGEAEILAKMNEALKATRFRK